MCNDSTIEFNNKKLTCLSDTKTQSNNSKICLQCSDAVGWVTAFIYTCVLHIINKKA